MPVRSSVVRAVLAGLLAGHAGAAAAQSFPANDNSWGPSLSADGNELAFFSLASNLVRGDTNGVEDVFVLDRGTGAIVRASVNASGQQGDGQSYASSIDASGTYVVFASNAANLVAGDTNRAADVFRKNLATGEVVRVNTTSAGAQVTISPGSLVKYPSISGGGRFVTWYACMPGLVAGLSNPCNVFLKDLSNGAIYAPAGLANDAGGASVAAHAVVSLTGGPTTFYADLALVTSDGLVAADTNGTNDAYYVRLNANNGTFTYELASRNAGNTNGGNAGVVSGLGETGNPPTIGLTTGFLGAPTELRIAYASAATDIVAAAPCNQAGYKVFTYDVVTDANTCESDVAGPTGLGTTLERVAISANASHIVYYNRVVQQWRLESAGDARAPVVLGSFSQGGSRLEIVARPAVSNNGTVAAFVQDDTDPGSPRNDTRDDVFLSVDNAGVRTVSLATNGRVGTQQDGHSRVGSISADGRYVAFSSYASGFGVSDPGADRDVYRRDLAGGTIARLSSLFPATKTDARWPDISGDGSKVVFLANAVMPTAQCADGLGAIWLWTAPSAIACLDAVNPAGATTLIASAYQQPVISDNGNVVAFAATATPGGQNLYRKVLPSGVPVAVAPYVAFEPTTFQLSADGQYLVYTDQTGAGSVSGEGCYQNFAVKRYNASTGLSTTISEFNGGMTMGAGAWPSISPDGTYVAFVSCENLANEAFPPAGTKVFLWNSRTGGVVRLGTSKFGRTSASVKARTRVSASGRYVAWIADNTCINRCSTRNREVLLYDTLGASLTTISSTPAFTRANGPSGVFDDLGFDTELYSLDINGDGRKVVFGSAATNFVPRDFNAADDVFLVDVPSRALARVSAFGTGLAGDLDRVGPAISSDGGVLAYGLKNRDGAVASTGAALFGGSSAKGIGNKWGDVAINDDSAAGEQVISQGGGGVPADGDSGEVDVSGDGSVVVYSTNATNLSGTQVDTNNVTDIVIYEMQTGSNSYVTSAGNGPSADASVTTNTAGGLGDKWVAAFTTDATNLQSVAPVADTNNESDVLVAVEVDGIELVSRANGAAGALGNGASGEAAVIEGGNMVAFSTLATNLKPAGADTNAASDIILRDLDANVNVAISDPDGAGPLEADGPSSDPVIADPLDLPADWLVAFESDATNLRGADTDLNGNTDIYVRFETGEIRLVSHRMGDPTMPANGTSTSPQVSSDGQYISFVSNADDIVANDLNGLPDVFLYNVLSQNITRFSVGVAQVESNDLAVSGDIATDPATGDPITVFDSAATNLTATPDTEEAFDVYYVDANGNIVPVGPSDLMFRSGFEDVVIQ